MHLHFITSYTSKPGEIVFVALFNKKDELLVSFQLEYKDENTWIGTMFLDKETKLKTIRYQISVSKEFAQEETVFLYNGCINFKKIKSNSIEISHGKKISEYVMDVRKSKPFKKVFKPTNYGTPKFHNNKKATHIFKISYPLLLENIFICLTGTAKKLNLFNNENPILFVKKKNNKSVLKFNFSKEIFPIEYKIAFYDTEKKCIIEYEPGSNMLLQKPFESKSVTIIYAEPNCRNYLWKGAGINIPVFSLRTKDTWGSGDFLSIKVLVDYASLVGIKMIQLLPVNDTIASFTDKDSYPYSAISSFALNPLYLNVEQLINNSNISVTENETVEIKRLNNLSCCDFTAVINLKLSILKRIFHISNINFLKEKEWQIFYENSYEWLFPYAVFCILRDKHKSVNTKQWAEYEFYDVEKISSFVERTSEHFEDVLFWYFVQYHLHLQLKDASKYAHNNKVILKADLPIGIAKQSVDAWVNPKLFHMNMQAGAPPDAFSTVGQNWQFPTYNIKKMREDGFAWFIMRMKRLENYFDALRIDHVLGLFRIWSIPQNQIDGTMGTFVPAIALTKSNFIDAGYNVDEARLCDPYITENFLCDCFGKDVEKIKEIFFDGLSLKEQFDDQQKIESYLKNHSAFLQYEQQLFNIVSNVILLKAPATVDFYHFRINMQQTYSFKQLGEEQKNILNNLYNQYFFENQNNLWQKEGTATLSMLVKSSKMLLCAEDLGMVPPFTEKVLEDLNILSLQIQQMPKTANEHFSDTCTAKYPCVVMPATHDMAPIRLWWEKNKATAQLFFNTILKEHGNAPYFCEPWVCKKIIQLHLQSPAMWSVFLLQDLMAIDGNIRRAIPAEERINDPANLSQVWNYRMHLTMEELMQADNLNHQLTQIIKESGR